jgi:hypothetical protein
MLEKTLAIGELMFKGVDGEYLDLSILMMKKMMIKFLMILMV